MKNSSDCGCSDASLEIDPAAALGELGDEPDIQKIEQALGELASEGQDVTLEVAGLEGALEEAEAGFAFAADEADLPTLGSVLAIAERFPGLKITFSF